jgi:hypothetical protein
MTVTFRNFALLGSMSRISRASIAIMVVFLALVGLAEARTHPMGAFGILLVAALIFTLARLKIAKRRV